MPASFGPALFITAACMALLCVGLFFRRRFPDTHVDGNAALRKKGIRCAQAIDAAERRENPRKVKERSPDYETTKDIAP